MPKKVLRSDSGVTLLEISFALGILVMTLSMLFGALINMQRSSQTVDSRSVAVGIMRSASETIRSMSAEVVATTTFAPVTRNGIDYAITVEFEDDDGNLVGLPVNGIDLSDFPNPIQARITLAWIVLPERDGDGEIIGGRAMQLTTRTLVEGVGPITIPGT